MVGNFSDHKEAEQMADIFDQVFAIAIPVQSKIMLAFNAFVKNRSIANDQKALIHLLAKTIKNRVTDSDHSQLSALYTRPIPLEL